MLVGLFSLVGALEEANCHGKADEKDFKGSSEGQILDFGIWDSWLIVGIIIGGTAVQPEGGKSNMMCHTPAQIWVPKIKSV